MTFSLWWSVATFGILWLVGTSLWPLLSYSHGILSRCLSVSMFNFYGDTNPITLESIQVNLYLLIVCVMTLSPNKRYSWIMSIRTSICKFLESLFIPEWCLFIETELFKRWIWQSYFSTNLKQWLKDETFENIIEKCGLRCIYKVYDWITWLYLCSYLFPTQRAEIFTLYFVFTYWMHKGIFIGLGSVVNNRI